MIEDDAPRLPQIPSLEGITDPALRKILEAVKETLEVREGTRPRSDALDTNITFRDLYKYGLASIIVNGQVVTNPSPTGDLVTPAPSIVGTGTSTGVVNQIDLSKPPLIENLIATGTQTGILLEWKDISSNALFGYVEIFRNDNDDIGNAVPTGTSDGSIYPDIIGREGATYYYWARIVSKYGVVGDFNAQAGTPATTGTNLDDSILTADSAKFLNVTAAHANVYDLSASRINTGTLRAGTSIVVGTGAFRVVIDGQGNVRSGATGFNTGVGMWQGLDGNKYKFFIGAQGGNHLAWDGDNVEIEGNIRNGQPAYGIGTGLWAGKDTDGVWKISLGNTQKYIKYTGDNLLITTDNFILTENSLYFDGDGVFRGQLAGATGVFSGSLTAGVLDLTSFSGETHVFSVDGTYTVTVPVDKNTMRLSLLAATGGGGFGGWENNVRNCGAGGAGGTNIVVYTFSGLTAGATYTVIVGAKGLGARVPNGLGARNGTNGGKGGNTLVKNAANVTIAEVVGSDGGGGGYGDSAVGVGSVGKNGANNGKNGGTAVVVQNGFLTTTQPGTRGIGGTSTNGGNKGGDGGEGAWDINPPNNPANIYGLDGMTGKAVVEFSNPNSVVLRTDYNILLSALQRQGIAIV